MKKIGLIDIEPKIFNTALMQISFHHKNKGDTVEWAAPLEYHEYDVLYCSSLFDFTDKSQIPQRAICGGTGFNLTTKLDFDCDLDYSIYPECKTSIIWFSRGCNRNCPWCVVREKEGRIHSVKPRNLNPNGEYIPVQDNNFFANPDYIFGIMQLLQWEQPVDFQGIDIRTLIKKQAKMLLRLKHYKQIKIAWDNENDNIEPRLRTITKIIKSYKLMCYVLIGYYDNPEADLYRVETLRKLKIDPFVMPYNKKDLYEKAFARWVNHKAIFKTVKWQDYWDRVRKQESAGKGGSNG
ncbi:MAG TPA: hypothetical protein ENH82_07610 [bacterium]|nr:hypothetical protein [bacterium]